MSKSYMNMSMVSLRYNRYHSLEHGCHHLPQYSGELMDILDAVVIH